MGVLHSKDKNQYGPVRKTRSGATSTERTRISADPVNVIRSLFFEIHFNFFFTDKHSQQKIDRYTEINGVEISTIFFRNGDELTTDLHRKTYLDEQQPCQQRNRLSALELSKLRDKFAPNDAPSPKHPNGKLPSPAQKLRHNQLEHIARILYRMSSPLQHAHA